VPFATSMSTADKGKGKYIPEKQVEEELDEESDDSLSLESESENSSDSGSELDIMDELAGLVEEAQEHGEYVPVYGLRSGRPKRNIEGFNAAGSSQGKSSDTMQTAATSSSISLPKSSDLGLKVVAEANKALRSPSKAPPSPSKAPDVSNKRKAATEATANKKH
jgi:hypothetical protein